MHFEVVHIIRCNDFTETFMTNMLDYQCNKHELGFKLLRFFFNNLSKEFSKLLTFMLGVFLAGELSGIPVSRPSGVVGVAGVA